MANKSYRIKTEINEDKYVSVNLQQGVHLLNILSLSINTEDDYYVHNSNYGVIVGRVLANDSFGVPNVKVSVFIPITDDDYNDDILSNIYPFTTLQSKDNDGVRYNLVQNSIGTFPNKRFVLDNDGEVEIFDKYWKYTTVTNQSGDYMLFGIPTGNCQVHYDCDLSDIGLISQKPYDFINKGYSTSLFKSPTEFLDSDIDDAIHILSQDKSVYVWPFWGDESDNDTSETNNTIGITRNDINLDYKFEPSCIFMGSSITDSDGTYIGIYGNPNGDSGKFNSLSTSSGDIEIIRKTIDGKVEALKENVQGIIDGNGVWCYQIPMNLDRIGMDEEGNIIVINNPNKGIPTRARVRFRITLTSANNESTGEYAVKMLVPNNPKLNALGGLNSSISGNPVLNESTDNWERFYEFGTNTPDCCFRDLYYGKIYSIKQYYPRFQYGVRSPLHTNSSDSYSYYYGGYPYGYAMPFACISSIDRGGSTNAFPYNTMYSGAENRNDENTRDWFQKNLVYDSLVESYPAKGLHFCFENDWINGCLYFPRVLIHVNSDGEYRFFGSYEDYYNTRNVSGSTYISGRHNIQCDNGSFSVKNSNKWDGGEEKKTEQEDGPSNRNTTIYSLVEMHPGIVKQVKNSLGQYVFYYRSGDKYTTTVNTSSGVGRLNTTTLFQRLYATDIILLGNVDNIYDTLPNLADKLPSTTCLFPPVGVPDTFNEAGMNMCSTHEQLTKMYNKGGNDSDYVDIFGHDYNEILESDYEKSVDAKRLFNYSNRGIWVERQSNNKLKQKYVSISILLRSSLFFSYRVDGAWDFLCYMPSSFANLSRICELDVHNDHSFYAYNYTSGTTDLYPLNGIIDGFDISSDENRSLFASMNYDITNYVLDNKTHRRKYSFTPLYLTCFEGRLSNYCTGGGEMSNPYLANIGPYKEYRDSSYVRFRYGRSAPLFYTGITNEKYLGKYDFSNYGGNLLLTENSLYFYFGLRAGMSAIDVYRNKYYNMESSTEDDLDSTIITYQILSSQGCIGNGTTNVECKFTISSIISAPIEYELSDYAGNVITTGTTEEGVNEFTIDEVPVGQCNISVSGANSYTASLTFYITTVSFNVDIRYDIPEGDTKTGLYVLSIENSDVSGYTISGNDIIYTTENGNTYTMSISEDYNVIDDGFTPLLIFEDYLDKVQVSISDGTCVRYQKYITLNGSGVEGGDDSSDNNGDGSTNTGGTTTTTTGSTMRKINNVPVIYLANWTTGSSISDDLEFPSIDCRSITKNAKEIYKFGGLASHDALKYISSMMAPILVGNNMSCSTSSNNDKCQPFVIRPDWDSVSSDWDSMSTLEKNMSVSFDVDKEKALGVNKTDYPQLVGENYPTGVHKNSLLKLHDRSLNGETNYVENQYLRNKNGVSGAFNAFAFIRKGSDGVSAPCEDAYPTSYRDQYSPDSIKGYYKVRTIDTRFDYEIAIETPLLLPSGYNYFVDSVTPALKNGGYQVSLYGGLRFDHDEYGKLTSYTTNQSTNSLEGSASNSAQLYQWSFKDISSYNGHDLSDIIEAGGIDNDATDVTYIGRSCIINQDGIDSVSYSYQKLNGNDRLVMNFVECSTSFNTYTINGTTSSYVNAGRKMNLIFSYNPGAIVYSDSTDKTGYDVKYSYVSTGSDGTNKYSGSFDGSDLTFSIGSDVYYEGETYTDVYYDGTHNGNERTDSTYPAFANAYIPTKKKKELSILRYSYGNLTGYRIANEYTVKNVSNNTGITIHNSDNNIFYACDSSTDTPVPDSGLTGVYFKINNGANNIDVFDDYGYISIPTRKMYTENANTQLRQAVVYNNGYAYYASKIEVKPGSDDYTLIVKLYSPLAGKMIKDSNGYYTNTSFIGDGGLLHTIGEIESSWVGIDVDTTYDITYDKNECEFTISVKYRNVSPSFVERGESSFPFYFKIKNGLQYYIDINLDKLTWS